MRALLAHHYDQRGIGLIELGEIAEGGQLIERAKIVHQRASAEGDHDAAIDAGRNGLASGRGLFRGNRGVWLREQGDRRHRDERGGQLGKGSTHGLKRADRVPVVKAHNMFSAFCRLWPTPIFF